MPKIFIPLNLMLKRLPSLTYYPATLAGFYLGLFVSGGGGEGKSILKKISEPHSGEKIYLSLLGGPGACSPGKV